MPGVVLRHETEVPMEEKGPARVAELITYDDNPELTLARVVITGPYPPHSSDDMSQIVYVEEGHGEAVVDGETYLLRPGSTLSIPAGSVHSYQPKGRASQSQLVLLVANAPGFRLDRLKWPEASPA